MTESQTGSRAEALGGDGFPAQQQEPPGLSSQMHPHPDHGEETYVGRGRLEGLRALVTGGDSGIGRATAIAFAREGARVAICYLPEEQEDAEAAAAAVGPDCPSVTLLPADLREESACQQVVADTVHHLGGLDVLVNNAAFQWARDEDVTELSTERLDRVFKTNLYALFWLVRAAVPHLAPGSSIINVTSVQAYEPSPSLLDYAATKAAINNVTVNLAGDLGEKGIRVNAVAPGPIWTPLQPATQPEEKVARFGQDTPLGRAGQPAEVAPALVFLASPEEASYVSGTVLGVTGGKPIF